MEVSGKRYANDQTSSSADADQVFCQPCNDVGNSVPARKFCQDCQQFLCQICCEDHKKFNSLKHHVLLNMSELTAYSFTGHLTSPVANSSAITRSHKPKRPTVTCDKHKEKLVSFFCPQHSTAVCEVCVLLGHKLCVVDYIPDISDNYQNKSEYRNLRDDLKRLETDAVLFAANARTHKKQTAENGEITIELIKQFREKINAYLQSREAVLVAAVKQMRDGDIDILETVRDDCNSVGSEVKQMRKKLQTCEGNCSDLFISTKEMYARYDMLKEKIANANRNNQTYLYEFDNCAETGALVFSSDINPVGKVRRVDSTSEAEAATGSTATNIVESASLDVSAQTNRICISDAKAVRLADIKVESTKNRRDSWFTGIAFTPPNLLLLADFNNESVICVNCEVSFVSSYLVLPNSPWDITVMGPDKAAVTMPGSKLIQIISFRKGLSAGGTMAVQGKCYGIAATAEKLLVSFVNPGKVEVLDHYGATLHTISADFHGNILFKWPYYVKVTTGRDQEVMFVSDRDTNSVSKMSMYGDLLYKYADEGFCWATGIDTCEYGNLLACCFESDTVLLFSESGKKVRTLLKGTGGIYQPQSVCYRGDEYLIYVGSAGTNTIMVYQMKRSESVT